MVGVVTGLLYAPLLVSITTLIWDRVSPYIGASTGLIMGVIAFLGSSREALAGVHLSTTLSPRSLCVAPSKRQEQWHKNMFGTGPGYRQNASLVAAVRAREEGKQKGPELYRPNGITLSRDGTRFVARQPSENARQPGSEPRYPGGSFRRKSKSAAARAERRALTDRVLGDLHFYQTLARSEKRMLADALVEEIRAVPREQRTQAVVASLV